MSFDLLVIGGGFAGLTAAKRTMISVSYSVQRSDHG